MTIYMLVYSLVGHTCCICDNASQTVLTDIFESCLIFRDADECIFESISYSEKLLNFSAEVARRGANKSGRAEEVCGLISISHRYCN